jgi:signal transduction histidine kinase
VALAVGDFNNDGAADLAVASGDNTVSVFLGSRTGAFLTLAPARVIDPVGPAAGELNNAGLSDVGPASSRAPDVLYVSSTGTGMPPQAGILGGSAPQLIAAAALGTEIAYDLRSGDPEPAHRPALESVNGLSGSGEAYLTAASLALATLVPLAVSASPDPTSPAEVSRDANPGPAAAFGLGSQPSLAVVNGGSAVAALQDRRADAGDWFADHPEPAWFPEEHGAPMNRRILIQVTAPAVIISLLLFVACLVSAWYVNRLQGDMAAMLDENVSSLQAAKELESAARQIRFHCCLYLVDPDPGLLRNIAADEKRFGQSLRRAEEVALTAEERTQTRAIATGFARYRREFERQRAAVASAGPRPEFHRLAAERPFDDIIEPCREYSRVNEQLIAGTMNESHRLSRQLRWALFLLGLGGSVSGLIGGYGIARGLSRSIHRLSVRVHDMAQHLDRHVAALNVAADTDLVQLDRHLQRVVRRVAEVAGRLQRHQHELLRAQQLSAVGQLAASVAHEVRNPLTSMKMLVEAALRSRKPRPFTAENLTVIHREIVRLEATVQNFLDFARPPALHRTMGDLREVVAQAVELVRARSGQQGVRIHASCPDRPETAHVDRAQLCTVLVNLFMNALDAMPGGGRLDVSLATPPGCAVRLTVADTGPGIGPEMAGRLFTPFASSKPTGSGLGLSISRRIVEEHGGTLTAANRPEGGACLTITLPACFPEDIHADPARH